MHYHHPSAKRCCSGAVSRSNGDVCVPILNEAVLPRYTGAETGRVNRGRLESGGALQIDIIHISF